MEELRNKIAGALYGVAIGDALGAPLEFMTGKYIKEKYGIVKNMIGGGWLNTIPGQTTDDTEMTIAVANGIVEDPDKPVATVGKNFINWFHSSPNDIGNTCFQVINKVNIIGGNAPSKHQWFNVSKDIAEQNKGHNDGNGALMRTIYPGLYYKDLSKAIAVAEDIAKMTHWSIKSTETCKLYTKIIHNLIENNIENPFQIIDDVLQGSRYSLEIKKCPEPTGYVVDTFNCVLYCISKTKTLEDAIIEAVNLGGDTDTIGAITGGLAGVIYGYDSIPKRWVSTLNLQIADRLQFPIHIAVQNRNDTDI